MQLGAFAIDEFKAYRQIPLAPDQRRFSVIAVVNPAKSTSEYFVMNGHIFGAINAVYNYNRRPLAVQAILEKCFWIVTDHYYDDRWVIEPMETIESAAHTTLDVFQMLGIRVQEEKIQGPPVKFMEARKIIPKDPTAVSTDPYQNPELLGVTFDLRNLKVKIQESRKTKLIAEMEGIISKKTLTAGHASKIKGKLQFATCSLFGRVGRSFMTPLSERQYEKIKRSDLHWPLEFALRNWIDIIDKGMPRPISYRQLRPADAVWFTDGMSEGSANHVGGVLFCWWRKTPAYFSVEVPQEIIDKWLPRKNQIALVEIFASVILHHNFSGELFGKRVIGMIDSECALDALIKGVSKFGDVVQLLTIFWRDIADNQILWYGDKIPTDGNISDGVSRQDLKQAEELGWERVHVRLPEILFTDRIMKRK